MCTYGLSFNTLCLLPCSGSTSFSTCSEKDFEKLVLGGGGVCLRNQPSPSDVIGTAECGNGRLDKGEECDCGKPEVEYCLPDKLTLKNIHKISTLC